jgi:hypothetical protein
VNTWGMRFYGSESAQHAPVLRCRHGSSRCIATQVRTAQEHRAAWSRALDQWVATLPYGVRGEADPLGWFVV